VADPQLVGHRPQAFLVESAAYLAHRPLDTGLTRAVGRELMFGRRLGSHSPPDVDDRRGPDRSA
jgi:hypothetical protein